MALIYRHFNLGGSIQRAHVELARHLSERGHEVHVFSIGATRDKSIAPDCMFHDVPVATVRPGAWSARELVSFAFNSRRLVRSEPFDAIHTRLPSTWVADILYLGGVARGELERAPISSLRRLLQFRRPAYLARLALERRAVRSRRVSRFHVDSDQVLHDLVRYHDVDPSRVLVLPPGVNLDEFRAAADRDEIRRELGLPHEATLLLFCGHDFNRKGLERAVAGLARMSEAAELIVVGGGADGSFRELASTLGVSERVHFYGARQDAARFFQAADVFLLPTHDDMWGATVVEAMATGIPPVVTDVAGSADVVEDGETGYVLRAPYDADELAAILDRLTADRELRLRMGAAASLRARTLAWSRHVDVLEAELIAVADSPRGRSAVAA